MASCPFDTEILDNSVGQQFAAHVFDHGIRDRIIQIEFNQLSLANPIDARKAKTFKSVMDRFPLGIEYAVLESDMDSHLHRADFLGRSLACACPIPVRCPQGKIHLSLGMRSHTLAWGFDRGQIFVVGEWDEHCCDGLVCWPFRLWSADYRLARRTGQSPDGPDCILRSRIFCRLSPLRLIRGQVRLCARLL